MRFDAAECDELGKASIRCLEAHGYDRGACQEAFSAYRECKKEAGRKKRETPSKSIADLFR